MGKDVFVFIVFCIGLFYLLLLPELDKQNDKPLCISIQTYIQKDSSYFTVVKARYDDQQELINKVKHLEPSIYRSYIELYFDSANETEFYNDLDSIKTELNNITTNIINDEQIRNPSYNCVDSTQ